MRDAEKYTGGSGITDYFTLLFITHESPLMIGEQLYNTEKNDLILCRENISWHSAREDAVVCVCMQREFFDELFFTQIADCKIIYDFMQSPAVKDEYLYFRPSGSNPAIYMLKAFLKEAEETDVYHVKMMHLLAVGLCTCLDRSRHDILIVPNSTMNSDNRFGRIMKYIGEHYSSCTLQETAEKFGYHPDYLSYRFKMITGVTFTEKLRSMRLYEARHLLITTDMTIEQIAEQTGFSSKSWFTKTFTETFGTTPGRYRKDHTEKAETH